jgi:hypothetical protein
VRLHYVWPITRSVTRTRTLRAPIFPAPSWPREHMGVRWVGRPAFERAGLPCVSGSLSCQFFCATITWCDRAYISFHFAAQLLSLFFAVQALSSVHLALRSLDSRACPHPLSGKGDDGFRPFLGTMFQLLGQLAGAERRRGGSGWISWLVSGWMLRFRIEPMVVLAHEIARREG